MSLSEQILNELAQAELKASELAKRLNVDRTQISQCLYRELLGQVQQDSQYRWGLIRNQAIAMTVAEQDESKPFTELGRLCRYYLECIGQDTEDGVSAFAASRFGPPDYVELPRLPLPGTDWDWWNTAGVGRVLEKVLADRRNLVAWLGYPVRLRQHRTPKWEGFFVEPVMLWPIRLPEKQGDQYRLEDELPGLNFSFLKSLAMGDPTQVIAEAARLGVELGLDAALEDQPEVDELLHRLASIRPDWDWKEGMDLLSCSDGPPMAEIQQQGIYNRAIILPGKRSPYTQGLESELKQLSETSESSLVGTALGHWLSGDLSGSDTPENKPLIEVLPMNTEQRAAVQSALDASLTVVTGPPGTGKSQVVTNLLINAAWRNMKVLFASKNNKAVDVVEERVNGLGNRPVLLRMGAKEYQAKLGSYLTAMLSGRVSPDDELNYQEGLERHKKLLERMVQLEEIQGRTLATRNLVDRLDSEAEDYRVLFGAQLFNGLEHDQLAEADDLLARHKQAIDAVDPELKGFLSKMFGWLTTPGRVKALKQSEIALEPLAAHLGMGVGHQAKQAPIDIGALRAFFSQMTDRVSAARKILEYQTALDLLRSSPSFEDIAKQRQELTAQLASNSAGLWRDWVQMTPARLSQEDRRDIADYAAILQLINSQGSNNLARNVWARAKALQQHVTQLFSCWAVTSLSARGKVPFVPGYFDLVVIDEASQCDIASALPLLFRAKRAVIIGDPMQLQHISSMTQRKESELQQKYGLVENRAAWMYSVNSLYDLAAGVTASENIVNLRDHHRSHADIIEFSNQQFYAGRLRVATPYSRLKRPNNREPGVLWRDVRGRTHRPPNGSAVNAHEAEAVVAALDDLLLKRGFEGTVGVVTPFQAQYQLIRSLIAKHSTLAAKSGNHGLLVDTVHKFQGDERDVMLFSPVVSEGITAGALAFLRNNGNLFNVAITRARGLLHVIGDREAARNSGVSYLADFEAYVSGLDAKEDRDGQKKVEDFGSEYPSVSRPERVSDWEREFYRALYQAGIRPIPQFSVEQYDLDFALFSGDRKLNIEVDGERYHRSWTGELCLRDQLRNQRLIELGWGVKRFWVYEIRDRMEDCVSQVARWANTI